MTVTRYEHGTHRIPGAVEVAISQLASRTLLPMAGLVAVGRPIEPVLQAETVDVPPSMTGRGENFALRIKGDSMRDRDERILPGDVVIVRNKPRREPDNWEWLSSTARPRLSSITARGTALNCAQLTQRWSRSSSRRTTSSPLKALSRE